MFNYGQGPTGDSGSTVQGQFGKFGKSIVKNSILDLGVAGGVSIGGALDSTIGFSDGGLLTGKDVFLGIRIPEPCCTPLPCFCSWVVMWEQLSDSIFEAGP